jgi:glycolate dehydrogenase iron-sulfur subunit
MRTNFTAEQRQDPEIAAGEAELRRCVHCGLCSAACPTYALEGNELDSPRGRILLIQHMLEKGGAPEAGTVFHLDRCLSCLSCVSACPSGVDYGRLIDSARTHIAAHAARPLADRLFRALLARVLPSRAWFDAALGLGRLAKPLAGALPARLAAMLALVPPRAPREAPSGPGLYPAAGTAKLKLVLFRGCLQQALAPQIEAAAIRVLTKLGAEIVIPEAAGCCGALTHHLGDAHKTRFHAQDLIERLGPLLGEDIDHLIVTAAGCGTLLKDYGQLCAQDAALAPYAGSLAGRVLDVSEAVARLGLPAGLKPPRPLELAYQSACSLQHGQKIDALPKRLLAEAGYRVLDLPEPHLCCGSAGTYNMLEPDLAARLRERKLQAIEASGAEAVASGNLGCMSQLAPGLVIPIAHSIEWLDWALGGKEPQGLG